MKPFSRIPDPLREDLLDIHMDILVFLRKLELPALKIRQDPLQTFYDLFSLSVYNDPLFPQHGRMGHGPGDIFLI